MAYFFCINFRTEPPSSSTIPLLVEEYLTYQQSRQHPLSNHYHWLIFFCLNLRTEVPSSRTIALLVKDYLTYQQSRQHPLSNHYHWLIFFCLNLRTELPSSRTIALLVKDYLNYQQTRQHHLSNHYHWLIFFCLNFRTEPPSSRTIALLVEEYLTYQQSRPGFVVDTGSEVRQTWFINIYWRTLETHQLYIHCLFHMVDLRMFPLSCYTPCKLCLIYPPQTLFVVGILFSRCPCIRPFVTFCFFNFLKSHCWIFIKPCNHVHICKTNTLDKKVRARGQFY